MATLMIRDLDDEVKARLRVQAAEYGRSMEAEARALVAVAVSGRRPTSGLGSYIRHQFAEIGGEPSMSTPPTTMRTSWQAAKTRAGRSVPSTHRSRPSVVNTRRASQPGILRTSRIPAYGHERDHRDVPVSGPPINISFPRVSPRTAHTCHDRRRVARLSRPRRHGAVGRVLDGDIARSRVGVCVHPDRPTGPNVDRHSA